MAEALGLTCSAGGSVGSGCSLGSMVGRQWGVAGRTATLCARLYQALDRKREWTTSDK